MKDIPLYLFTGFLEAGKTKFINETLCDERFNAGEKTLLVVCESGIEEYDISSYPYQNVVVWEINDKRELNRDTFKARLKETGAERVIVEYNGMWELKDLFAAMPECLVISQEFMFADATTILSYNINMRQLVYDKMSTAELIIFNRVLDDENIMPLHKLVRAISRRADIAYEYENGYVRYDDIEDPLPFDVDAETIVIEDKDYALWFQDMMNDMDKYCSKTIKFKGIVARDEKSATDVFVVGRHIMTCCADDIQYCGIACDYKAAATLKTNDWVIVTASFSVGNHKLYRSKGPYLTAISVAKTSAPEQAVATFY